MKTASAPGKLMLFGEHAVVYNHPCIATAVNKRMYVSCERIAAPADKLVLNGSEDDRFVRAAIDFMRQKIGISDKFYIETHSDFTDAVGLGSSSAIVVATLAAVSYELCLNISKFDLMHAGVEIVRQVQGKSSGYDIATAVYGGTIYFDPKDMTVTPITFKKPIPIIVAYSGEKGNTAEYIGIVAKRYEDHKDDTEEIFSKIETITKKAHQHFLTSTILHLGYLMNQNHSLLRSLEVSTDKLDRLVQAATSSGAIGAKLSGAGGGDCIVAIVITNNRNSVKKALEQVGGELLDIKINAPGLNLTEEDII